MANAQTLEKAQCFRNDFSIEVIDFVYILYRTFYHPLPWSFGQLTDDSSYYDLFKNSSVVSDTETISWAFTQSTSYSLSNSSSGDIQTTSDTRQPKNEGDHGNLNGKAARFKRQKTNTLEVAKVHIVELSRQGAMSSFEKKNRERNSPGKSKKSRKKQRKAAEDAAEEERLTNLLFGGGISSTQAPIRVEREEEYFESNNQEDSLFELDRVGEIVEREEPSAKQPFVVREEEEDDDDSDDEKAEGSGAAWHDDDDVQVDLKSSKRLAKLRESTTENTVLTQQSQLEKRLRKRYESTSQIAARTDWANIDEDEQSEDEEKVDSSEPLLLGSTNQLSKNILNTMRVPDANLSDPNKSTVQAVHFHPGSDTERPLLLTAGFDKTLRFFQVGTDKSEKVHGIHCKFFSSL